MPAAANVACQTETPPTGVQTGGDFQGVSQGVSHGVSQGGVKGSQQGVSQGVSSLVRRSGSSVSGRQRSVSFEKSDEKGSVAGSGGAVADVRAVQEENARLKKEVQALNARWETNILGPRLVE